MPAGVLSAAVGSPSGPRGAVGAGCGRTPCTSRLKVRYPSQCRPVGGRGRLPERPKGAVCKTVGSAFDGSNPSPATTSQDSPQPGASPVRGLFFSVPLRVTWYGCGSLCCGAHGRIADGSAPPGRWVAPSAFPRTATDGPLAAWSGLTPAAEVGASLCPPSFRVSPGRGRPGKAGALRSRRCRLWLSLMQGWQGDRAVHDERAVPGVRGAALR